MTSGRLILTSHAILRMSQWSISEEDVHVVVATGEVIEEYPEDTPYVSRLVLGWQDLRPIHVVAADNIDTDDIIVITVYEPDPQRWEPGFRTRRAQ